MNTDDTGLARPLNPLAARSTYAAVLMIAAFAAQLFGYDLLGFLESVDLGIGVGVLDKVEILIMAALAIWAWLERLMAKRPLRWVWRFQ